MNTESKPFHVLVVDDQLTQVEYLKMLLAGSDFEISVARSGEEALKIIPDLNLDLVLLDIVMPGMSGLDVMRKLHNTDATSSLPVIIISTRSELEYVEGAFEEGCGDYITKPVDRAELLEKIHALTGHA